MRIAIGCDHTGIELKAQLTGWLGDLGHDVQDVGPYELDPLDDYPDFTKPLAEAVASGSVERGIMVCGSGVGASVAANKVVGVRAAVCHDTYSAHQGVEHDDMNVLCLGARIISMELAKELVSLFLGAAFSGQERHVRRLNKVIAMEQSNLPSARATSKGTK
jgi:ribose 5-phosphate isomerase B